MSTKFDHFAGGDSCVLPLYLQRELLVALEAPLERQTAFEQKYGDEEIPEKQRA